MLLIQRWIEEFFNISQVRTVLKNDRKIRDDLGYAMSLADSDDLFLVAHEIDLHKNFQNESGWVSY